MIKFAKAQFASFAASMADYLVFIVCKNVFGFWYLAASCLGTIIGGITNFSLGRNLVFRDGERERHIQLFRYFLVWVGYLSLMTYGVYLLTHFGHLDPLISKVSVSLFLAITWNYPLQKRFVFK